MNGHFWAVSTNAVLLKVLVCWVALLSGGILVLFVKGAVVIGRTGIVFEVESARVWVVESFPV